MNPLRKLASQTAVYGLSSIIGRFLNYLLVPLYTYTFSTAEYGIVSEFYAYAGFLAVLLVFGLETGYFRFSHRQDCSPSTAYGTALGFLLICNTLFLGLIFALRNPLAEALQYPHHPEYLLWFAGILTCDSISALPFAKLRAENRAVRFATIKLAEIVLAIAMNLFFLVYCRKVEVSAPDSFVARLYDPAIGIGYIFLANLAASLFKVLLLLPQFAGLRCGIRWRTLKPLLAYSLPMVIIGLAGMINEMLDRAILKYLLPYDPETNLRMLGIYGACYKLSILMSLFVQAFRYAGEPFFFAYAERTDARRIYALVMNYFVIFCVFIFLLVTLYLDFFKYFIGEEFRVGLPVVPILLMANLFLGIYVNLSIWYKLTDRTLMGAWVSVFGALLTVVLNIWWIPRLGYEGSAWATLVCYFAMASISYLLGRRYYPVQYPLGRIFGYLGLGLALYSASRYLLNDWGQNAAVTGSLCLGIYILVALLFDGIPLWKRRLST